MIVNFDAETPKAIGNFAWYRNVYIQVIGSGTLRLSTEKETLQRSGPAYAQQGLAITSTDGIKRFPWRGSLWGMASAGNVLANIEIV